MLETDANLGHARDKGAVTVDPTRRPDAVTMGSREYARTVDGQRAPCGHVARCSSDRADTRLRMRRAWRHLAWPLHWRDARVSRCWSGPPAVLMRVFIVNPGPPGLGDVTQRDVIQREETR